MITLRYFAAGALACALAFVAVPKAKAQSACGFADPMVAGITGPKYREVPQFDAMVKTPAGPMAIRMFANPQTGTWTMLTLRPNGMACIAGIGIGFRPARAQGRDA